MRVSFTQRAGIAPGPLAPTRERLQPLPCASSVPSSAKSEEPGCISPAPAECSPTDAIRRDRQPEPTGGGESVTHEDALAKAALAATLSRRKRRGPFPMTGGWIQKLTGVGEHRALRIRRLMIAKRMIVEVGSYRQRYRKGYPSGWRVALFRPGKTQASIRRRWARKQAAWWKHPLFGGEERPRTLSKRLQKWKEKPEWHRGVPMIFSPKA